METLRDKTAIITGASQGIGRAISMAMANEGVNVVLASRNLDKLTALQEEIKNTGGTALAVQTDVTSIEDCKRLAERAVESYGQVDILVNNAGLRVVGGLDTADPEDVTRMVQVNVLGVYYCTYAVLPFMKSRTSGHIINISSEVAIKYFAGRPMYTATKSAVKAFSEGLSDLVEDWNIRVTTIYPGRTDTPMVAEFSPEERKKFLKPEHVGRVVVHALSYPDDVAVSEILIRPSKPLEDMDYS